MRKSISLSLLFAILLIITSLVACGNEIQEPVSSVDNTTGVSNLILTYPFNPNSEYADYAVSLPNVIFNTTAAENGLRGTIYAFEGTVTELTSNTEVSGEFTYHFENAFVETNGGVVKIVNMFKAQFNTAVDVVGEEYARMYYTDDVDDYVLPQIGEYARFIVVYDGYSGVHNMPLFVLGASPAVYKACGCDDPLTLENESTDSEDNEKETVSPSNPEPTENTAIDTIPKDDEETLTDEQKNALRTANDYLKYSSFSRNGLVGQLKYEGFSNEDAEYAVDNCGADWYEQALLNAEEYLSYSSFSYSGLIKQLEYEEFTSDQARYAADNCGADWFEQAVKCAEKYLDYKSFSRQRLIEQLEYEGFTYNQAVYGVEHNGL